MKVSTSELKSWIIGGICFLIIPNIVFWILGERIYLIRGIFVAEYFFIALLYPFVPARIFNLLWIVCALIDLLFASTLLFFMDLGQMFEAAAGLQHFSFGQIVKWVLLLSLFILVSWVMLWLLKKIDRKFHFLKPKKILTYLLVVLAIDLLSGANTLNMNAGHATFKIRKNVLSAPLLSVGFSIVRSFQKERKWEVTPARSVAKEIFGVHPDTSSAERKQILILVESWGLNKNDQLQSELTRSLNLVAEQKGYTINKGQTPYRYLTQIAEMREITGYLRTFSSVDSSFISKHSLFLVKQRQGYHVIGLHAYSSGFYNRQKWWPSLGVQEMFFANEFSDLGLPFGGNPFFRGAEDTAIANWLMQRVSIQKDRKEFYHWVTLNTHLPLLDRNSNEYKSFALRWKNQGIDPDILQLSFQLREFFENLSNAILRSDTRAHILLIGDHAPPFLDPAARGAYDGNYVPYIELRPK